MFSTQRLGVINLVAALLGALLITGVYLVATVRPANAAFSDCPTNFGCLFSNVDGGGTRLTITFSTHQGSCYNLPEGGLSRNDAESAVNRYGSSNVRMRFFEDLNCGGLSYTLNNGYQVTWLWLNDFSNNIESYRLLT